MIIKSDINLVGDFLGTLPAIIEKNQREKVQLIITGLKSSLISLIPKEIELVNEEILYDVKLDIHKAFAYANDRGLYMSQCYYQQLGLPTPFLKEKVFLEYRKQMTEVVDYVISPFSLSLPENQKVNKQVWQDMVDDNPNMLFALIGVEGIDDANLIEGKNVVKFFNRDLHFICNLLRNSDKGLISLVTGTAHLAFHLTVFNILFTNQLGVWGNNPEAFFVKDYIPSLTYEKNIKKLIKN